MIQFNLLPDVKMEYIKTKRNQQLITTIAGLVAIVSLVVLIMLFTVVDVLQKKHLNDVNNDIATYTKQLKDNQELPKILTVQNQLKTLPTLYAQAPLTSRLFGYIGKVIPANVEINQLNADFVQHTLTITGTASSLTGVNQFVDTLKLTTYTTPNNSTATNAFKNVVLTSFSINEKGAAYTINLNFDPLIFDAANVPTLNVPSTTITHSVNDEAIFKSLPKSSNSSGGQ